MPGPVLHTGIELVAFILLFAIFRVLEMTKMYVYFCFHSHFTYEAKEVSNEAKWFNVTHLIRDRIVTHIHVSLTEMSYLICISNKTTANDIYTNSNNR